MRSIIVGAFATSAILLTGPLALAEEPATSHYTAHHRRPVASSQIFPASWPFLPTRNALSCDDSKLHPLAERGEDVRL